MNAKISQAILNLVAAGMSIEAAFDVVLGAGSYETMAGEVYEALRS